MEEGRLAEDFAHSVYQQICDGYGTIQKSPSPILDRLHGNAPRSNYDSEMSERAASPFTASIAGSEYCQSAAGEADLGSSANGDIAEDCGMPSPCDDDMDEDDEHDLSSDPPPQRSDEEWERIGEEIREMENCVAGMTQYEIVDKLGEGTFSTVYKAIDKNHFLYDNYIWTGRMPGPPPPDRFRSGLLRPQRNNYVALKRIYVTSSPQRILNELEIMETLRDCQHIAYLVTAFRTDDQIIAVMPYCRHSDFREYYRIMPLTDLKCYFRCLFGALQGAHANNIMHRDIKPANFLYDPRTGHGTLCDFGLAERFDPQEWHGKCHHNCPTKERPHGKTYTNRSVLSVHLEYGGALQDVQSIVGSKIRKQSMGPPERIGIIRDDTRPSVRANRAGTRGFRAPEVLLKCQDQTPAIDIWSAGIIMLAFLTKRFPLFNSNDDTEALLELAVVFGKKRMTQAAILHNRVLHCNVPTVNVEGFKLADFVLKLNQNLYEPPWNHPNREEYIAEIKQALDLCKSCLQPDLTRRCTATEALNHSFLALEEEEDYDEGGVDEDDDEALDSSNNE